MGNSCGRHIVSPLQVLTGFLIYDWIEKPHKQEVIKEVLSLLEQKILEPSSGEAHDSHCTRVSEACAFLHEQGHLGTVSCAILHNFRVMFVVYLEIVVCDQQAACVHI